MLGVTGKNLVAVLKELNMLFVFFRKEVLGHQRDQKREIEWFVMEQTFLTQNTK